MLCEVLLQVKGRVRNFLVFDKPTIYTVLSTRYLKSKSSDNVTFVDDQYWSNHCLKFFIFRFETKGTMWAKNMPTGPVGLHIDEKELTDINMSKAAKKNAKRKEKKKQQSKSNDSDTTTSAPGGQTEHNKLQPSGDDSRVKSHDITSSVTSTGEVTGDAATRRLRNLRKKLRHIDDIQGRIDSGELVNPEKDQLEKVGLRDAVVDEIENLMLSLNVEDWHSVLLDIGNMRCRASLKCVRRYLSDLKHAFWR